MSIDWYREPPLVEPAGIRDTGVDLSKILGGKTKLLGREGGKK